MTAQSGFSFNDFAAARHVAASPEHQGAPMEVTLYSDGSSRGNPGPGGYGTILRYTAPSGAVHEKELSAGFPVPPTTAWSCSAASWAWRP